MTLTRRGWLAGLAGCAGATPAGVRREVFLASPRKGVAVMAAAFYTRPKGGEMMSIEQRWTRSDTIDVAYYRRSADHGRTWSEPEEHQTGEKVAGGMLRRHPRGWFVEPRSGRTIEFWVEGVLPSDDPLEGMRQWNLYYRVSTDGGRTAGGAEQVIHKGAGYGPGHPLPGVFRGKNSVMLGDMTCRPLARPGGEILLPVCISPLGPDGKLANPGGGYTYEDTAILHGRWKGRKLEWEMSELIRGDPARSTRGAEEPTIEALDDGRLICLLRGSNDRKPELPGYRWASFSGDGGWKWTKPEPWTYTSGETFFSPAACSQLLKHSSGRLFWLGNLLKSNPRGNRPRYPFVLGEVDRRRGLLMRESVRVVDDRGREEDERLTLSNFFAREDRETGEIALHMTRLLALPEGWSGDALLYRVGV